jgi:hypothetical protein
MDKATLFENFKTEAYPYLRHTVQYWVRHICYGCIYHAVVYFILLLLASEAYVQGLPVIERGVTTDRTGSYTFIPSRTAVYLRMSKTP